MAEPVDTDLLQQFQDMLRQQQGQDARHRAGLAMAQSLGTPTARAMVGGIIARQTGSEKDVDKTGVNLLMKSIEAGADLPQEVFDLLGQTSPLSAYALRAYQQAIAKSPEGKQREYFRDLTSLRELQAMDEFMTAQKATGQPVPGLELPVGETPTAPIPTREETIERAHIGQQGLQATEEQSNLTPTAMALVLGAPAIQAGTQRMQELRASGAAQAPEYEIREDSVRLPDGSEQKRFYWLDKRGQAPPMSIVGEMSAPALNDVGKNYAQFQAAIAAKDYKRAQVYLRALEKSTASEGFILTQTPEGLTIAQGPATDQVLNRRYAEQKNALDTFEDTLAMLDSLQRTAADFGPGGFLQGITQGIIAGGGAFVAGIDRLVSGVQPRAVTENPDGSGKDFTSKWFNPKLQQAELLTHTLALVRAGIYGQSGRSLSDRDMENFARGIKAGSVQEWQAIKTTLQQELALRRTRLDQYTRDLHPTQRSPLYFLYEEIPGGQQGSLPTQTTPARTAEQATIDARVDEAVANNVRLSGSPFPVTPELVKAVIEAESNYNPRAVSPRGAQGLMQLMPATAKQVGVTDPLNPDQNIAGGITYLQSLMDLYQGDIDKALAAYNAGPGAVEKYGGVPPYPETIAYIDKIRARLGLGPRVTQAPKARRPALDKALDFVPSSAQNPGTPGGQRSSLPSQQPGYVPPQPLAPPQSGITPIQTRP